METVVAGWGLFLVRAALLLACGSVAAMGLAWHPRARVTLCRTIFLFVVVVVPWLGLLPIAPAVSLPSWSAAGLPANDHTVSEARDDASFKAPAGQTLSLIRHPVEGQRQLFDVAFAVWLTGAGLFLARWLIALVSAQGLRASALPAPAWINETSVRLSRRLGLRDNVRVVVRQRICSPLLIGPRPMIILPDSVDRREDIETALAHELAHVQARDWWWSQWLQVVGAIVWPVPFTWWLRRVHDEACELVCDHVAASLVDGAEAYAGSLARQGLFAYERWHEATVPMVSRSGLRRRLEWLRAGTAVPRLSRAVLATGGVALVLFTALLGSLRPAKAADEKHGAPDVANPTDAQADGGTFGKDDTLIYRASVPDQPWNGWGFSSPPNPHPEQAPPLEPEKFDLVENGPKPRTFSGKVVVQGQTMAGVEVGLISLVGIQWNMPNAYYWQPVAADGSFSITDAYYTDAPKALAVRGPYTPWTFLRYNFSPTQAATNIALKADSPKIVRLTASGSDMENLSEVGFEPFHAHTQYDDAGRPLRRQQLNYYKSGGQKFMDLVLPLGEIAIFVHHQGFAGYYQVIDTRRASHFHFVLLRAGQIKLTVLDREGQPKSDVHVDWINPAAPLSIGKADKKEGGSLLLNNLVPGTFAMTVRGFATKNVVVAEGKTTDVQLQEGIDP